MENELAIVSRETTEIQAAYTVAMARPRDEELAYKKIIEACKRPALAKKAAYSFDRGRGEPISGPSVHLAREIARAWGNIIDGYSVLSTTEDTAHLRAYAQDLESNVTKVGERIVKLLIYRKIGGWQKADERQVRELLAKEAAILIRNCILQLIPGYIIDDALAVAKKTLIQDTVALTKKDPTATRLALIKAFDSIGVSMAAVENYIGSTIDQITPEKMTELRQVYQAIKDGVSTVSEYFGEAAASGAAQLMQEMQARKATLKQQVVEVERNGSDD